MYLSCYYYRLHLSSASIRPKVEMMSTDKCKTYRNNSISLDKSGIRSVFFLFVHENICCGYSLKVPQRGTSNEYHNICFRGQIRKISILLD